MRLLNLVLFGLIFVLSVPAFACQYEKEATVLGKMKNARLGDGPCDSCLVCYFDLESTKFTPDLECPLTKEETPVRQYTGTFMDENQEGSCVDGATVTGRIYKQRNYFINEYFSEN